MAKKRLTVGVSLLEESMTASAHRIITLNCYLANRKQPRAQERFTAIKNYIGEKKPDIFLLQEVGRFFARSFDAVLGEHYYLFDDRHAWDPQSYKAMPRGWKTLLKHRLRGPRGCGLMIGVHRESGLRPTGHGYISLPKKFSQEALAERALLAVSLRFARPGQAVIGAKNPASEARLLLLNTHLSPYAERSVTRNSQLEALLAFADLHPHAITILGGDLNFRPDSAEYRLLQRHGGLDMEFLTKRSPADRAGKVVKSGAITWSKNNPLHDHQEPEGKLDYLWLFGKRAGDISISSYQVPMAHLSDHYPVEAEWSFAGE